MPEYDFFSTVAGDLELLRRELAAPGVDDTLKQVAQKLHAGEAETLAAMWRSSKRHGETLAVFCAELTGQFERETARQTEAAGAT